MEEGLPWKKDCRERPAAAPALSAPAVVPPQTAHEKMWARPNKRELAELEGVAQQHSRLLQLFPDLSPRRRFAAATAAASSAARLHRAAVRRREAQAKAKATAALPPAPPPPSVLRLEPSDSLSGETQSALQGIYRRDRNIWDDYTKGRMLGRSWGQAPRSALGGSSTEHRPRQRLDSTQLHRGMPRLVLRGGGTQARA